MRIVAHAGAKHRCARTRAPLPRGFGRFQKNKSRRLAEVQARRFGERRAFAVGRCLQAVKARKRAGGK